MRSLIFLACLSLCLQACGGDTSVALFLNWGSCDFDRDRWARADRVGRGCMVASFLDSHHPHQLSTAELRLLLGEPTGHAGDGVDPAYVVERAEAGGRRTTHLLVFTTDRRSGRIAEVQLRPLGT